MQLASVKPQWRVLTELSNKDVFIMLLIGPEAMNCFHSAVDKLNKNDATPS